MVLTIILLALTANTLYRDFQKDKGAHTKAKVTQAIVLGYVIVMYTSAISLAGSLVRQFPEFQAKLQVPVGVLSADLNLGAALVQEVLSIILLFAAFSVARRKLTAVSIFRAVLLVSIPTEVISFYRAFETAASGFPTWAVLLLGLILACVINLGIYLIYGSRYMRDFLRGPVDTEPAMAPTEGTSAVDVDRLQP